MFFILQLQQQTDGIVASVPWDGCLGMGLTIATYAPKEQLPASTGRCAKFATQENLAPQSTAHSLAQYVRATGTMVLKASHVVRSALLAGPPTVLSEAVTHAIRGRSRIIRQPARLAPKDGRAQAGQCRASNAQQVKLQ